MAETINVDLIDSTIPIACPRLLPVIHKPNPQYGVSVNDEQLYALIQFPRLNIYEAGTRNIINGSNYYDYFPTGGGGGGGGDTPFTPAVPDTYNLLTTEPTPFDPTEYYKLVNGEYVRGSAGDVWATNTWYQLIEGHSGTSGAVPAPTKYDADGYLRGDGVWSLDPLVPSDNDVTIQCVNR